MIDQQQWNLYIDGETVPVSELDRIAKMKEFADHISAVEDLGFELLVKRAKIGASKHVRVRPMFRSWELRGSLTVLDPERTGLSREILRTILDQAGALCGIGDWRPSSPKSPGVFGRFSAVIE